MGLFSAIFNTVKNIKKGINAIANTNQNIKAFNANRTNNEENSKQNVDNYLKTLETNGYEIKKNLDTNIVDDRIGESENFYAGIYSGEQLLGVVDFVAHNREKSKIFTRKKIYCQEKNIPFAYFYSHMKNAPDYIEYRVKKFVNI